MGMPVVTVASGGMPVVSTDRLGAAVTIAANGLGMPVTVVSNGIGMPVTFTDLSGAVVPPGAWVTAWSSVAFDLDSPNWTTTPNMRQHWNAALLLQNGSKVRLTLQGPLTEGSSLAAMYFGDAAAASPNINFLASPAAVQVKVGGNNAFVVPANQTIVTDEFTFAFDKTKPKLLSAFFNNAALDITRGKNSVTNCNNFFKGGASEVANNTVTGYTQSALALRMVNKIEVFQAA